MTAVTVIDPCPLDCGRSFHGLPMTATTLPKRDDCPGVAGRSPRSELRHEFRAGHIGLDDYCTVQLARYPCGEPPASPWHQPSVSEGST